MGKGARRRLLKAALPLMGAVIIAGVWVPSSAGAQRIPPRVPTLTAIKVAVPPTLDGTETDPAWAKATALKVPVIGGRIGFAKVTLKAVYTATNIYLLARWPDKTMNVEHHPYTYDGRKWVKTEGPFEDRFAIQWNISVAHFNTGSCALLCHAGDGYPNTQPRMHTNGPREFTDEWHWKAARTDPMGYVDDKYVDHTVDPTDAEVGHHPDGGVRAYTKNTFIGGAPAFVWKSATPGVPPAVPAPLANRFLLETDKAPYGPMNLLTGRSWAKGDKVPVALLRRPTQSNADIRAFGFWSKGAWTLEIGRALDTGTHAIQGDKKIDVIFDPSKVYYFGIAVFDNAEGASHAFAARPIALIFR